MIKLFLEILCPRWIPRNEEIAIRIRKLRFISTN